MGMLDGLRNLMTLEPMQPPPRPALQERSFLEETIIDIVNRRYPPRSRVWRRPSTHQSMGVPAIFRAVTLISTMTGMMALEAYRKGERLEDDDRPYLIKRPDPFRIPRDFYVDTSYGMARYGETWWWIAKREPQRTDGRPGDALSLLVIPSHEVVVEENPDNALKPTITWRDRVMPNEDMRQICFMKEPGELRGFGPLQMCGAAASVAVESQEWAANFFGPGGYPSTLIKAAGRLSSLEGEEDDEENTEGEVQALKRQWTDRANNEPVVIDEGIEEVKAFPVDPSGAQMLEAREFQNGDVARMFGIPASMLDYGVPGSSLTYQNIEQEFTKFLEVCLQPGYLEPIEQTMSDLLPNSTVARFNVDALRRADVKTRFEVYEKAVTVFGEDVARDWAMQREGLIPGDVENAPVPFAPPRAIPTAIPQERSLEDVRCDKCGAKNGEVAGAYRIACRRCGQIITAA